VAFRVAVIVTAALLTAAACSQNPMEPRGFPQNPPRDSRLPPPPEPQGEVHDLNLLSSASWEVTGNLVSGKKVVFEYRGYRVQADEAEGDLDTQRFALRGDVNILTVEAVVRGESVAVDFRARTFRMISGEADLKKALTQGRLLNDVYITASELAGSDTIVRAKETGLTTCNLEFPHYLVQSRSVTLEPNRRLVFDDFRLKIGSTTVLGLPHFVVPLNRRTDGVLPDVGNSPDEGYYVKTKIGLPIGGDTAFARLDLMSKKGIGVGAAYDFQNAKRRGSVSVYSTQQAASGGPGLNANLRYSADLGFGKVEATGDFRQFSYLSGPNTIATQGQLRFIPYQPGNATTMLTLTQSGTRSSLFGSDATNLSLSDSRSYSKSFRSTVQLNWARNVAQASGSTVSSREVVDARVQTSYDMGRAIAELDYQRNIPIGSSLNFLGGVDRTPELTLRTDTLRLFGDNVPKWMPGFSALISAGNYHDGFNQVDVGRYFLDLRVNRHPAGGLFRLDYDLGFRQGVYTDNTAQYTPSANILASYRAGKRATINARYNFSHQYGFSPIQFDRTGNYNVASIDGSFETLPGLTFGGQVGFDFDRDRIGEIAWVSPSLRMEYRPSEALRLRAIGNYLPQNGTWGNVRMDLAWKAGETFFGLAARYDAHRQTWGNANLYIDALKIGKLKVSALMLYNGYLHRFDSRHLALTYDLHCAEVILQILENNTGFRPGREVVFFIRLKALPFSSPFGAGRSGQPLDFGTGGGW
jgi:hypothetical protein